MKNLFLFTIAVFFTGCLMANCNLNGKDPYPLTMIPANATAWDEITLTLDAKISCPEGALLDADSIMMHSGVTINGSPWSNIVPYDGFGANGMAPKFESNGDSTWSMTFVPAEFYGIVAGSDVTAINCVFNAGDWASGEGKAFDDDGNCVDFIIPFNGANYLFEGTWKIAYEAGAIGVGPGQGNISWWSNSEEDLITRACYFDDEYIFGEDGSFMNVMGTETWVEEWQGNDPPGCDTPVAPHNGSNAATWMWDDAAGELTLNGVGAFLGLAKVFNGGELTSPDDAPESITYLVVFSNDDTRMTVDIEINDGGWWRFLLDKVVADPFDVTMNVNMSAVEDFDPAVHSVYMSGNIINWPEPGTNPDAMLTQVGTSLIYTITVSLDAEQEVMYKYFSDVEGQGWDGGEWVGDPNRTVYITNETTLNDTWGDIPLVVTFMVDVSTIFEEVPDSTEIYMAGTINYANNWNQPGTDPSLKMSPTADDPLIYELSMPLPTNEYQYKYFYVNNGIPTWDFCEWNGDPNREVIVDSLHTEFNDIWGLITDIEHQTTGPISAIFPNPCTSTLNITLSENSNEIRKIEIYSLIGGIVKTIKNVSTQSISVNTNSMANGVYVVAVHSAQGVQTTKFIKE
jgi:hypothetical protein